MLKYMMFAEHPGYEARRERLVAVLDVSRSMRTSDWLPSRLHGAREATEALILAKASAHPEDEVGIVSFSDTATLIYPLTALKEGAAHLVRSLRKMHIDSSTNIAAGLMMAESALFRTGFCRSSGRRSGMIQWLSRLIYDDPPVTELLASPRNILNRVILLTDGDHNTKGVFPVKVARGLKEKGVVIDCIGIASRHEVKEGTLKTIASIGPDGSPRYAFIGDKLNLIKKFRNLANHIRLA